MYTELNAHLSKMSKTDHFTPLTRAHAVVSLRVVVL